MTTASQTPGPWFWVFRGCQPWPVSSSIVRSGSVWGLTITTVTRALARAVERRPGLVRDLDPVDVAVDVAVGREPLGQDGLDREVDRGRAGREDEGAARGEDLGLGILLGCGDRDQLVGPAVEPDAALGPLCPTVRAGRWHEPDVRLGDVDAVVERRLGEWRDPLGEPDQDDPQDQGEDAGPSLSGQHRSTHAAHLRTPWPDVQAGLRLSPGS